MNNLFRVWLACFLGLLVTNCAKQETATVDKVFDFLVELDKAILLQSDNRFIHPSLETINDETQWAIFQHAPSSIEYKNVWIGDNPQMIFGIGIAPGAWGQSGDGLRFEIIAEASNGERLLLFSKYIDPKHRIEDRKWHHQTIALDQIKSGTYTFYLRAEAGETELSTDNVADWGLWASPKLLSKSTRIKPHQSNRRNIVLITLDTCRVDYIGCYGNSWVKTPAIDRLAKNGVMFINGIAASSTTLPSHISILTSLMPYQHEAVGNDFRIGEAIPTLQQILVEQGYKTGAAVSVYHLSKEISGLDKYFDWYAQSDLNWNRTLGGDLAYLTRGGEQTTNAAIEWIQSQSNEPFFLWIHYYDPHFPYAAIGEYHKKFYTGNPTDPMHDSMKNAIFNRQWEENSTRWLHPITDLNYFKREYGAEISYVDAQIKRLVDCLDQLNIDDNTIIALTADHGENLGEHDIYFDHWTLFDTDVHVPLVFYCPSLIPGGKTVDALASHIDIAPTLLDLIGESDNSLAQTVFQGISLKPFWNSDPPAPKRVVRSDSLLYSQIAAVSEDYKIVWDLRDKVYHERSGLDMDRVTIYDRNRDPDETNPVGCFFWGEEAEMNEFRQYMKEEINTVNGENEPVKQRKRLQRILELVIERAGKKVVPDAAQLKTMFTSGRDGVFLQPSLQNNEEFFSYLIECLAMLKDGVSPKKSLIDILNQIPEYALMDAHQKTSHPIMNKEMMENQGALGYTELD